MSLYTHYFYFKMRRRKCINKVECSINFFSHFCLISILADMEENVYLFYIANYAYIFFSNELFSSISIHEYFDFNFKCFSFNKGLIFGIFYHKRAVVLSKKEIKLENSKEYI